MDDFTFENEYHPMPAPRVVTSRWNALFAHEDPLQGNPIGGNVTAVTERGQRRQWRYVVQYAGGATKEFIKPCIPLPITFSLESLRERMANTFRQDMHDKWQTKMATVRANIVGILKHRKDDAFIPCWDNFFDKIPPSAEVPHHTYENYLQNLARHHGGVVQVPLRVTSLRPMTASYYFDSITWRDGPLSRSERQSKLKEMGIGAAPVKKGAANAAAAKRGAANTAAAKRGAVNTAAAKRGAANAAAKKRAASEPGKKRRGRPKQNSSSSDEDSVQSEEDSEEDDEAEHSYDDAEEEQGDDTSATKQEEEGCGMVETGQDGEGAAAGVKKVAGAAGAKKVVGAAGVKKVAGAAGVKKVAGAAVA
jgi:hypothetical protein